MKTTYETKYGFSMQMWDQDTKICRDLMKVGEWEPDVAQAIIEYANSGWTFLDLGAHIGFFTLLATRYFKDVIAVEPVAPLWKNVSSDDAEVWSVAVTDISGEVEMVVPDKGNMGMAWVTLKPKPETVTVKSLTLPEILGDRRPEFIKVDIEGSEFRAFKGCPEILEAAQIVLTEYCTDQLERTSGCSGRDYYDLTREAGLNWYTLSERPIEFKELPTGGYNNFLLRRD